MVVTFAVKTKLKLGAGHIVRNKMLIDKLKTKMNAKRKEGKKQLKKR